MKSAQEIKAMAIAIRQKYPTLTNSNDIMRQAIADNILSANNKNENLAVWGRVVSILNREALL